MTNDKESFTPPSITSTPAHAGHNTIVFDVSTGDHSSKPVDTLTDRSLTSPISPTSPTRGGSGHVRWAMLATACFVMFGNYYAFDNPAALNQPLQEHLGMSDDTYAYFINILYTAYSLPNIVLPWFGGYAVDRFGHRKLLLWLSATVAFGHLIVCLGVQSKHVPSMILGRVIFGAGETLAVTQSAITVKYFRGKELAMALGINLCVARLGSVLNDLLTPAIWKLTSVPTAFWGGFVSCVLSFMTTCLLVTLDRKYGSRFATIPTPALSEPYFSRLPTSNSDDPTDSVVHFAKYDPPTLSPTNSHMASMPKAEVISMDNLREHGDERLPPGMGALTESSAGEQQRHRHGRPSNDSTDSESDHLPVTTHRGSTSLLHHHVVDEPPRRPSIGRGCLGVLKSMLDYSQSFWMLFLMTLLLVGVQVPFNSIHAGFLATFYNYDPQRAAQIMTVPDLLSAVLVLPVGYFVDHYGQKSWLFMLCGLIVGFSHTALGIWRIPSPVPALMTLGVASAIGATITSAIPVLVQSHQIATAYGISTSAMNMAFTVFPMIVARLMTIDPTVYTYVEIFFASCGFCGFLLAVRLKFLDRHGDLDRKEIDNTHGGHLGHH
ncbi:hypothetical protein BGZ94_008136 [Podila epigama]|nr:hypothetical protein BGZ94_008136 [Podila epigama]